MSIRLRDRRGEPTGWWHLALAAVVGGMVAGLGWAERIRAATGG